MGSTTESILKKYVVVDFNFLKDATINETDVEKFIFSLPDDENCLRLFLECGLRYEGLLTFCTKYLASAIKSCKYNYFSFYIKNNVSWKVSRKIFKIDITFILYYIF